MALHLVTLCAAIGAGVLFWLAGWVIAWAGDKVQSWLS